MKVALSGFGRIGREVVRIMLEEQPEGLDLVAINLTGEIEGEMRLFQYDSLYGKFDGEIEIGDGEVTINGKTIKIVSERDPEKLPWEELGVELVIDATGAFTDREGLSKHIKAGAKKVFAVSHLLILSFIQVFSIDGILQHGHPIQTNHQGQQP